MELERFVTRQLQILRLQTLQTDLHSHDAVQQQVEMVVGAGSLVLVDLLLFHL